jgi:hypothetical protein
MRREEGSKVDGNVIPSLPNTSLDTVLNASRFSPSCKLVIILKLGRVGSGWKQTKKGVMAKQRNRGL